MRDVLDAVQADAHAAESRRQATRARWPDFAKYMDELPGARMVCIYEDGELVAGKPPPPDPASYCELSGDCVLALGRMGRK